MMANKRMFNIKIVDSDAFLDMPLSAQCLYFHLGIRAMDRGILNNVKRIIMIVGCSEKDLDILIDNRYIKKSKDNIKIVHWNENNGIYENAKERNTSEYKQWRNKVIERDKVCMMCGSDKNLEAHHIKRFSDYPLLRTSLDNGMTLCKKCHKKIHKELKKND